MVMSDEKNWRRALSGKNLEDATTVLELVAPTGEQTAVRVLRRPLLRVEQSEIEANL